MNCNRSRQKKLGKRPVQATSSLNDIQGRWRQLQRPSPGASHRQARQPAASGKGPLTTAGATRRSPHQRRPGSITAWWCVALWSPNTIVTSMVHAAAFMHGWRWKEDGARRWTVTLKLHGLGVPERWWAARPGLRGRRRSDREGRRRRRCHRRPLGRSNIVPVVTERICLGRRPVPGAVVPGLPVPAAEGSRLGLGAGLPQREEAVVRRRDLHLLHTLVQGVEHLVQPPLAAFEQLPKLPVAGSGSEEPCAHHFLRSRGSKFSRHGRPWCCH